MKMPKRGYLLAALVMLLSIAALKLWADKSWLGQGHTQSEAPAGASAAAQSHAQPNSQAVSSQTSPEAKGQTHSGVPAFISGIFSGAEKGNPQNGPQAVFLETVYDAGTVEAGADLSHTFLVKNTGKADLLIESVKPGWGCTVSDFTKVVPPGQEGKITLSVKTHDLRGMVQKTATVQSNDPSQPTVVLTIKSTIKQLIDILPGPYLSIQANKGETAEGKVTLVNNDSAPLKILDVKSANQDFTTALKTLEKGQRYELEAKLNRTGEAGRFNTTLTVTTDNKKQAQLLIPVMVQIMARVEAYPEKLVYGQINLESIEKNPQGSYMLNRMISVRSQEKGFKVTKVETTLPFVQPELVTPAQEGQPYSIKVTLAKDKLKKGPFSGTIIVRTNDKEFAEMKIPLTGEVN